MVEVASCASEASLEASPELHKDTCEKLVQIETEASQFIVEIIQTTMSTKEQEALCIEIERTATELDESVKDVLTGDKSDVDFAVALQTLRALRTGLAADSDIGKESLENGDSAFRNFCERPIRIAKAREWMIDHGLGHCATLLEFRGLLDKLEEVRDNAKMSTQLPEAWLIAGMPPSALQSFRALVKAGELDEACDKISNAMMNYTVPPEWTKGFSRSVGHNYYTHKEHEGEMQWRLPLLEEKPNLLQGPAMPQSLGVRMTCAARYLEQRGDPNKNKVYCLLCKGVQATEDHLATEAHQEAVRHWDHLKHHLRSLRLKLLDLDAHAAKNQDSDPEPSAEEKSTPDRNKGLGS